MKSSKAFFLCMLCIVPIYIVLDYYKNTVFLVNHHGLFIQFRTIIMMIAGFVSMYISLDKRTFKIFLVYYGSLCAIYGILKGVHLIVGKYGDVGIAEKINGYSLDYLNLTKLFSIIPFMFFFGCLWLITKVLSKVQEKNLNP
jgi:hypothetical protein